MKQRKIHNCVVKSLFALFFSVAPIVAMGASPAYTAVVLNSPGYTSQSSFPTGNAISGNMQGGVGTNSQGVEQALLWNLNQTNPVNLTPAGYGNSQVDAVDGNAQAGFGSIGYLTHALLWSGTAASAVDLNPTGYLDSAAYGISNGEQAGYGIVSVTQGNQQALIWFGSAASAIDLNPPGYISSQATGVADGQVVGYGEDSSRATHALLWVGTNHQLVDLNPSAVSYSQADGNDAANQVGYGLVNGSDHAFLWSGTAQSAVDLNPTGYAGSFSTAVSSANGGTEVGYGFGPSTNEEYQALLWDGSSQTGVNLNQFLPIGYNTSSQALGINAAGDVIGYGHGYLGQEAFVWEPNASAAPEPSGVGMLALIGLGLGGMLWRARRNDD